MAATVTGQAIIWGVSGISMSAGIISATTKANFQSASYTKDGEKFYVKDGAGEDISRTDYNLSRVLRLTVVPHGDAATSAARTSMDAWTPAPGTKVTIADSDGDIEGLHSGVWIVNSATQNRTNNGAATCDLELEQRVANAITTAVT